MDYQEELMQKQAWAEHKAAQIGCLGAAQGLQGSLSPDYLRKQRIQMLIQWYGQLLAIPANDGFRVRNQGLYGAVRDALAEETGTDSEFVQTFCEAAAV